MSSLHLTSLAGLREKIAISDHAAGYARVPDPISYLEPQNHSIIRPSKSGYVTEKDFQKHPLFRTVMLRNAFHPTTNNTI